MHRKIISERDFFRIQTTIQSYRRRMSEVSRDKSISGKSPGDEWHDDSFRRELVEEATIARQIDTLESILDLARVIKPEEQSAEVKLGCCVEVIFENGQHGKFELVGYALGQPDSISVESPIGQAILGAKIGEERAYVVQEKKKVVKVYMIWPPSMVESILDT